MTKYTPLKIAVSRCLLGDEVRYDGTAKTCDQLSILHRYNAEIIAFCPEVAIGMGVPRLPIQLELLDGQVHARRKKGTKHDYTESLRHYAQQFASHHADLIAVISKRSSPSCGFKNAKLFDNNQLVSQQASGIFINELKQLLPALKIIDEDVLADKLGRQVFDDWLKQKALQMQGS